MMTETTVCTDKAAPWQHRVALAVAATCTGSSLMPRTASAIQAARSPKRASRARNGSFATWHRVAQTSGRRRDIAHSMCKIRSADVVSPQLLLLLLPSVMHTHGRHGNLCKWVASRQSRCQLDQDPGAAGETHLPGRGAAHALQLGAQLAAEVADLAERHVRQQPLRRSAPTEQRAEASCY